MNSKSSLNIFKNSFTILDCVCMSACVVCVCVCERAHVYKCRCWRRNLIPWSWSYRPVVSHLTKLWESSAREYVILTTEPSISSIPNCLWTYIFLFKEFLFWHWIFKESHRYKKKITQLMCSRLMIERVPRTPVVPISSVTLSSVPSLATCQRMSHSGGLQKNTFYTLLRFGLIASEWNRLGILKLVSCRKEPGEFGGDCKLSRPSPHRSIDACSIKQLQ